MPPDYVIRSLATLAAVQLLFWALHLRRARFKLARWARSNGVRLTDARLRLLRRGPFVWTTSAREVVYRVAVEDAEGRARAGYVRCGRWGWLGWSDRVDVRWDGAPAAHRPGFPVIIARQDREHGKQ